MTDCQCALPCFVLRRELPFLRAAATWRARCDTAEILLADHEPVYLWLGGIPSKDLTNGLVAPDPACSSRRACQSFSKVVVNDP